MSLYELSLSTPKEGVIDITAQVSQALRESGMQSGLCVIHCPHTTASVTVNENADPEVGHDILLGLAEAFPDRREFRHMEGNSAAHLKSGAFGSTQTLIVEKGELLLGRWQGVYFCEFDGPRRRTFYVKLYAD